jgi:hypothetical protein
MTMNERSRLPRIYSSDDEDLDDEDERTTERRIQVATGIRSFFEQVVTELEDAERFRRNG